MIEAGFLIGGIIIGVVGMYLIAHNNQKHLDKALNADKDLKRRLEAAVRAAKA